MPQGQGDWLNFPCRRWLSTRLEDGRIRRELQRGSLRGTTQYVITTVTSALRGAGTDANVFIVLFGPLGHTSKYVLHGGVEAFER